MGSEAMSSPTRSGLLAALAVVAASGACAAEAQWGGRTIFQCEVDGKKITSDRVIPNCVHKEQKELNPDGSLKRIIPPTLTSDELAAQEQREREEKAALSAKNDAVRRDRNLMQRFPDEAAHRKAREKALDELRISVKNSQARIALLKAEQAKLDEEKKFYVNDKVNKPLPGSLKQKIDANDAALEAQNALAQNQQTEVGRINDLYDVELGRLKKLWSGTPPGTLGPMPGPKAAASAASTKLAG
jgi:uncharacterized small protein (DUF1192 family)